MKEIVPVCFCTTCKRHIIPNRLILPMLGTSSEIIKCPICRKVLNHKASVAIKLLSPEDAYKQTGMNIKTHKIDQVTPII